MAAKGGHGPSARGFVRLDTVVQARRPVPLAVTIALALAAGVVVPSSRAEPPARARAEAAVASGALGTVGHLVGAPGRGGSLVTSATRAGLTVGDGEAVVSASTAAGAATAEATAVARSVSLFDGLVTAYGVRRRASAQDGEVTFSGRVQGLKIAGRRIGDVHSDRDLDGDGVRVTVNHEGAGLSATLTKPSGRWAVGATVVVADVDAAARDGADPAATPTPTPTAAPTPDATAARPREAQKARRAHARKADTTQRRLNRRTIVFPVYGDARVADNFGAPREIGAHQGNDVFAPFGAPVLAVADGVLEKVGTLPISGNRLWLRSKAGDTFFYAHLSTFSPAATDGHAVRAGTVLGFVGNTGDAEPTPPHLHFEIHPDGGDAVDPNAYLRAWQQRGRVPSGAWLDRYGSDTATRPGALVEVRDLITGA